MATDRGRCELEPVRWLLVLMKKLTTRIGDALLYSIGVLICIIAAIRWWLWYLRQETRPADREPSDSWWLC